ncbi:peptide ABC transporter permease [Zobellella denitrificans]|jgi:cationic peptide transport system permease protein|uniref:Peptide ABC transporter permease n=1 Tax=Zobellella denitrificans TaxID=347534 RepID=A0A231MZ13_9GAMM|nr:ABC transporter permease subunit [Zobellella denitrificans]ATG73602.1 peptide ABC transporter permease [Zobellella denitrificans]OXS15289.1 peptide ABC transporter permease [Zobellella denitrificans]
MPSRANIYPELKVRSPLEQAWELFRKNTLAMIGLWGLGFLTLFTLLGPWLAPHPPYEQFSQALLLPPSWAIDGNIDFFLGTDDLGRDLLSRLIMGARLTFGNGVLVVLVALLVGGCIGILGGMSKGLKASILNHLLDTLLSIPSLLLAIIFVAILGPGLFNTLLAITLALTPQFIRATYNAVSDEMQKEYITALRLDGANQWRILRFGVLPNLSDTIVSQTTRGLSAAILDITAVGFLGLGAQPPRPEWGAMLSDAVDLIYLSPWTVILPGLAILLSVLVVNMVGEGLRQAINEVMN